MKRIAERYVELCEEHVGKKEYSSATCFAKLYGCNALYDLKNCVIIMGNPGSVMETMWGAWKDAITWERLYDYLDVDQ